jgi:WD40 repeat protein
LPSSAQRSGMVQIWSAEDGKRLNGWEAHTGAVQYVQFASQDSRLLSCGIDGNVHVWEWRGQE